MTAPVAESSSHDVDATPLGWFDNTSDSTTVAVGVKWLALDKPRLGCGRPAQPLDLKFAHSEHELSLPRRWADYDRHADASPCKFFIHPYGYASISKNVNAVKANAMMSPGMEVSLFDCLSDVGGCLMACCCGCIVSGFSAARLDNRECTIFDIFTNDYQVRQSLRAKYNMGFAPCQDCCSLYWCQCCFIMQTAKEVALKKGDEPVYLGEVSMNLMGDRAPPPASS
eukprot:jgi/Undpi1/3700/HiC_scaffold_16.g07070.m1